MVGFAVAVEGKELLTVSETGYGRKSSFEDYRVQSRAGKGLINYRTDQYGKVAMIAPVDDENDVIMITTDGIIIRTHADQISTFKRPGKGVKVMTIKDGEKLATLSVVDRFEEDDDTLQSQEDVEAQQDTEEAISEKEESLRILLFLFQ